ncbi:MAG: hypothetical protein ACJARX_002384 [Psychroserpens sp.]|jgi:hypothetical protein
MLGVIVFFLAINKIFNKEPLRFPIEDKLELEQYTFGFEEMHVNIKKIALSRKIVICIMVMILILTPLSDILRSDNFGSYFYNLLQVFS